MADFDYEIDRVIGYADIFNSNGNIIVVGYCDDYNIFHKLTDKEAVEIFPPRGRVFAHNFAQRNYGYKGELVSLMCIPNEKEGSNLDEFIWNKSEEVYGYGQRLTSMKGEITADGENNYNVFNQNGLIESDEEKLVVSDKKVYHVKANSTERIISYWNEASLDVISIQGKKFIADSQKPTYDGAIDLTSDDQLIIWYINKVLSKNWKDILSNNNFNGIESYIRDILQGMKNLETSVMESRMQRLKRINMSFVLSLDELKHIAETPWLNSSVEKSIQKHKDSFLSDYMKDQTEELENLKKTHQTAINNEKAAAKLEIDRIKDSINTSVAELVAEENRLNETIEDKKIEIAIADETIDKKSKRIQDLDELVNKAEARKSQIVEDFSIIKEVLNVTTPASTCKSTESGESKNFSTLSLSIEDEPVPMYQGFKKSIENTFKKNGIPHSISSTIGDQLAAYDILLLPNVAIAKGIILASKKCEYMTEYVSANWKSFDDLWENGLNFMVEACISNPDVMHFLILQNVNMTYLPNYMQPLVDMQAGIVDRFPATQLSFPDNLRILCTVTGEDVMPLSQQCLKYMGCVDRSKFEKEFYGRIVNSDDSRIGYLSVEILKQAKYNLSNVENHYKQYILDEE